MYSVFRSFKCPDVLLWVVLARLKMERFIAYQLTSLCTRIADIRSFSVQTT